MAGFGGKTCRQAAFLSHLTGLEPDSGFLMETP
jgi:hypothetical protein